MSYAVRFTSEVQRILRLHRRVWEADETEQCRVYYSALLRRNPDVQLRAAQALVCHEFTAALAVPGKGHAVPIRVGGGKTLITGLLPTIMRAERPLLLVPASLREKTYREFQKLERDWRVSCPTVRSYQELARLDRAGWLETFNPDIVMADEAQFMRNRKAAVTRRFGRYKKAHPECRFVPMSGSFIRANLQDVAHLYAWALQGECPLPLHWDELQEWGAAVNDRTPVRYEPGALSLMFGPAEHELWRTDPTEAARTAVHRRIAETPGITLSRKGYTDSELTFETVSFPVPLAVTEALQRLYSLWELPDGFPLLSALEVWRVARQLALGFWTRWDPRAPDEWMAARRVWSAAVRDTIGLSRSLDTPAQVANAVDAGKYPKLVEPLARWREIGPTFKPNPVAEWIDSFAVDEAAKWVSANPKGICWVEHRPFGAALAERGLSWYADEGKTSDGRFIEDASGVGIVASIKSNMTGRNLQQHYDANLLTSMPTSGEVCEQLIARTHRENQPSDTVSVVAWMLDNCHRQALRRAMSEAHTAERLSGPQKLVYASKTIADAIEAD